MAFSYYLVHKPYGVLSQFSRELPEHKVLGDVFDLPKDVYPVGRLDKDSEGLLFLTNDPAINKQLLDPQQGHPRTYHVQVEGKPDKEALQKLRHGVKYRIKGKDLISKPAEATLLIPPPSYPERVPPVRFRTYIPATWISLTLREGKNRQVRRMCAAVGFPVLRLIRSAIGEETLDGLSVGELRELQAPDSLFGGKQKQE
jgi:23S rRNA pseudouridine2457 synthase